MTGEGSGLDVGVAYRRSVRGWVVAVEGAGTSWTARTPCADWDVRQLVNHVVGEDRWTKPLVQGLTIAEVGDALDGDLLGEEPSVAARPVAEGLSRRWISDCRRAGRFTCRTGRRASASTCGSSPPTISSTAGI